MGRWDLFGITEIINGPSPNSNNLPPEFGSHYNIVAVCVPAVLRALAPARARQLLPGIQKSCPYPIGGEHGGTQVRQADGAGGGLEADSDSVHNTPCSSCSMK